MSDVKETARHVTVACKIPNGLILRVLKSESYSEPVPGGGSKKATRWVLAQEPVLIKGPAVPYGMAPRLVNSEGYALNHGIDADFWAEWLKQNADTDVVKNRLIYGSDSADFVAGFTRDNAGTLSGLEPLNMQQTRDKHSDALVPEDPRVPKGVRKMDDKAA